jgi:hypothetical protein
LDADCAETTDEADRSDPRDDGVSPRLNLFFFSFFFLFLLPSFLVADSLLVPSVLFSFFDAPGPPLESKPSREHPCQFVALIAHRSDQRLVRVIRLIRVKPVRS